MLRGSRLNNESEKNMEIEAIIKIPDGKDLSDILSEAMGKTSTPNTSNATFSDFAKSFGGSLLKGVAKFSSHLGDGTANLLLDGFKSKISELVCGYVQKYGIPAKISTDKISKIGNTFTLIFTASEIDYVKLTEKLLPLLPDYLKSKNYDNALTDIMGIIGDDSTRAASALLNSIDDNKKEQIIKALAARYQNEICAKLTELINKQKIDIIVEHIAVK